MMCVAITNFRILVPIPQLTVQICKTRYYYYNSHCLLNCPSGNYSKLIDACDNNCNSGFWYYSDNHQCHRKYLFKKISK